MAKDYYKSKAWLMRRYIREGKSIQDIVKETGASRRTIYYYIEKHGLKR